MNSIDKILENDTLSRQDLITLLSITDPVLLEKLYDRAYAVKKKHVGSVAYYRGLIEFSNRCVKDCLYCGIRHSNDKVIRFDMTQAEILAMSQWAYDNEYGSITLQSGERADEAFVNYVEELLRAIKKIGDGKLGITLCLGEQTEETYRRWFNAGGHRYLLRIETSNPALYGTLHPQDGHHSWHVRAHCLEVLRQIGYQVGTGVMIGLPGQTIADLADDILFYEKMGIDMIGMGPYVVHHDTPMGKQVMADGKNSDADQRQRLTLGLKMIAVTRLYLKNVNVAVTTALQALHPLGREMGLKAGGNILMPILTIPEHRAQYLLYDNKPCIDDNADKCKGCLTARVLSIGDTVGFGEWGDSPHFFETRNKKN